MKSFFNREPLTANTYAHLALGEIKPEGWLRKQLTLQAEGITGELGKNWDYVNEKSAWLGGNGDGWERAPYYLDGLVALAWTLDDDELKARAMKYIEWILASQTEDGWFGPSKNDDYWPLMICLKALYNYFTATADKRVLVLMDKFFKYEYKNLDDKPLKGWAVARGGENMMMALKLYNITGQRYLIELCKKLKAQTLDWTNIFHTFPNIQPLSKSMVFSRLQEGMADEKNGLVGENHPFFNTYYHQSHGVNNGMALKTPGVISTFKTGFKEQGGFKSGWDKLNRYHGVANGIFTCDEHINGNNPSAGTESCTVVETMYSIESLMDMGDFDKNLPDILEKIAYNDLPAFFTPDMLHHQYLQQTNQISAADGNHAWYNNSSACNSFMFGSENGNCCTANCGQGWPKFVSSLWYATNDDGLYAVSYAPCSVSHVIDGSPVKLKIEGNYPFDETVSISVSVKKPQEFPIYLRIPYWTVNPVICLPDGEIMTVRAGETACIRRKWTGSSTVKLIMTLQPRVTNWSHQSAAVEVGPLLMSMKLSDNEMGFNYTTKDKWAYALCADEPMKITFSGKEAEGYKQGEAPLTVCAKVCACADWKAEGDDAGSMPIKPKCFKQNEKTVELIPYGYTTLRISQFPVADMEK